MKRNNLWLIPCAFFLVCCVLDLISCTTGDDRLECCVKPALMLTLCITSLTWLHGRQDSIVRPCLIPLLLCGQLFGFAGDTMLMGRGFPFFAGGIGLFLIGHIFYITLFGKLSLKGLRPWQGIAGIAAGLAIVAAAAIIVGAHGAIVVPMGIYAMALVMLIFSTLMGVIRFGGLTWWLLLAGALLFTFSDALIGVRSFGVISPFMNGFMIMITYLAAQVLLAVGGLRLIAGK